MGIATAIETAVDQLLNNFVTSKSAALAAALTPIAGTGLTIYFILMGFAVARGEVQDPVSLLVKRLLIMGLVCGIALSAGEYQATAIEAVQGIQGALLQAVGGSTTVGQLVDNMAEPYEALANALWSEAVTGVMPNLSLAFAAVLVSIAQAFIFVVGLGMFLLSKVALALVLAIGPAFILCALWPGTQKFCESWIGQALNFALLNVLIGACITLLTGIASQFAAHILANKGTSAIVTDCVALLLCSGALAVVLLNVGQIASALAGGVSINGIGRELARRLMSGRDSGDKSKTPAAGGELLRDGSSSSGGSGSTETPLYQRRTIDNLRRAA